MKLRSYFIIILVLVFGITALSAQNAQGKYQRGVVKNSAGMPINQSSRLEVLNQGSLFFDVNLMNKTAVLYMGNSPVYVFGVRVVDQGKMRPRFRGQEFVLIGNTDQRLIIDEGQGVVFLKIKKRNGGVTKLIISRISVQQLQGGLLRYNLNDNANLVIDLNYNNGGLSSVVTFKGVPIFIMQTGYEEFQGRRNLNVLQLRGNSSGVIYFDRNNQTLYYKSPRQREVWTRIRKIER